MAPQGCWLSARCHRPLVPSCTALRIDMIRFCLCAPVCCQSELAAHIGANNRGATSQAPANTTSPTDQPNQPTSQLQRQHANRPTYKHTKCHISISQPDAQPAHQEPVSDIPQAGQTPRQIRNRKPTCWQLAADMRQAGSITTFRRWLCWQAALFLRPLTWQPVMSEMPFVVAAAVCCQAEFGWPVGDACCFTYQLRQPTTELR